ncbi:MAG: hypothetical protein IPK44_01405 [Candidatus Accumulibacter sp.]|jgi:signal-transduction protein with cAMP-binding, CBS, and nucleotidyltransferase domain|uniref:hypothetical protein n=1 Tax=Accumulibacter sp. TaxID=2053492 RepID=UPI00258B0EF8|nr:hypothetical protein [Accumulibacter sp.]MBK8113256.1 hypothetical protein [Accumulibacter sp.]
MRIEEALKFAQDYLIYADDNKDPEKRALFAQISLAAAHTAEAMMRQEARLEWIARRPEWLTKSAEEIRRELEKEE